MAMNCRARDALIDAQSSKIHMTGEFARLPSWSKVVVLTFNIAHCKKSWVDLTWVRLLELQFCDLHANNGWGAAAMQ